MESTNEAAQSHSSQEEQQRPAATNSVPASASGPPLILVVDDHSESLLLFRHFLSEIGKIEEAMSIDAALGKARNQSFGLVLIDVNLGEERTGLDLLHTLRGEPTYATVPIIACTAYALPGDRDFLLGSGFNDYVSKPFTRKQLLDVVRRYVILPS